MLALALGLGACGDDESANTPDVDSDPTPRQPPTYEPGEPSGDVQVSILEPKAGATLKGASLSVRALITSKRKLKSAAIVVDGASKPIDLGSRSTDGTYTIEVASNDGDHTIEVTGRDDEGKSGSTKIGIALDANGPELALLAPMRGFAETRRLLRGTVTDARGIAKVSYALEGQAPIDVTVPRDAKSVPLAAQLPLVPGANKLTVTLEDTVGNTRTETIDFRYGLVTSAGGAHSGTLTDGRLRVWGRNNLGQLGLGDPVGDATSRTAPELQPAFGDPAKTIASIAFNQNTSLAIASDGSVWTWGGNTQGQLGQGDAVNRSTPTQVAGQTAVYAAVGFSHALVLHADGSVAAFGQNDKGQIGDGSADPSKPLPSTVIGLPSDVVKIAAGSSHSVALTADGSVWVWGDNENGQLGGGVADRLAHPNATKVAALTDIIDIATGNGHVLALKADGTVSAWGAGSSGQLGYGENTDPNGEDRAAPVFVVKDEAGAKIDGILALFANGHSSYALTRTKQYFGWGQNFSGQLALGVTTRSEWRPVRAAIYTTGAQPKYFDELYDVRAIGIGATHTIVRTATGATYAWGWNTRGSLGIPTLGNNWAQVTPLEVTAP